MGLLHLNGYFVNYLAATFFNSIDLPLDGQINGLSNEQPDRVDTPFRSFLSDSIPKPISQLPNLIYNQPDKIHDIPVIKSLEQQKNITSIPDLPRTGFISNIDLDRPVSPIIFDSDESFEPNYVSKYNPVILLPDNLEASLNISDLSNGDITNDTGRYTGFLELEISRFEDNLNRGNTIIAPAKIIRNDVEIDPGQEVIGTVLIDANELAEALGIKIQVNRPAFNYTRQPESNNEINGVQLPQNDKIVKLKPSFEFAWFVEDNSQQNELIKDIPAANESNVNPGLNKNPISDEVNSDQIFYPKSDILPDVFLKQIGKETERAVNELIQEKSIREPVTTNLPDIQLSKSNHSEHDYKVDKTLDINSQMPSLPTGKTILSESNHDLNPDKSIKSGSESGITFEKMELDQIVLDKIDLSKIINPDTGITIDSDSDKLILEYKINSDPETGRKPDTAQIIFQSNDIIAAIKSALTVQPVEIEKGIENSGIESELKIVFTTDSFVGENSANQINEVDSNQKIVNTPLTDILPGSNPVQKPDKTVESVYKYKEAIEIDSPDKDGKVPDSRIEKPLLQEIIQEIQQIIEKEIETSLPKGVNLREFIIENRPDADSSQKVDPSMLLNQAEPQDSQSQFDNPVKRNNGTDFNRDFKIVDSKSSQVSSVQSNNSVLQKPVQKQVNEVNKNIEFTVKVELRLPDESIQRILNEPKLVEKIVAAIENSESDFGAKTSFAGFESLDPEVKEIISKIEIVLPEIKANALDKTNASILQNNNNTVSVEEPEFVNGMTFKDTEHKIIEQLLNAKPLYQAANVSDNPAAHLPDSKPNYQAANVSDNPAADLPDFARTDLSPVRITQDEKNIYINIVEQDDSIETKAKSPEKSDSVDVKSRVIIDKNSIEKSVNEQKPEVELKAILSGEKEERIVLKITHETSEKLNKFNEQNRESNIKPSFTIKGTVFYEAEPVVPDEETALLKQNIEPNFKLRIPLKVTENPKMETADNRHIENNTQQKSSGFIDSKPLPFNIVNRENPLQTDKLQVNQQHDFIDNKDTQPAPKQIELTIENKDSFKPESKVHGMLIVKHPESVKQDNKTHTIIRDTESAGNEIQFRKIDAALQSDLKNPGSNKNFSHKEMIEARLETEKQITDIQSEKVVAAEKALLVRDISGKQLQAQRPPQVWNIEEFAENIINQAKLIKGRNATELKVQLEPPHLGKMSLKLKVQNLQLHVEIQVETAEAKKIIQDNLPQLKETFTEKGMDLQKFDVFVKQEYHELLSQSRWDAFNKQSNTRQENKNNMNNNPAAASIIDGSADVMRSFGYNTMEIVA